MAAACSPILYQNADRTVTLIDIPASIAHAQGFQGRVFSSKARDLPFPSAEPKTQKARDEVLARQGVTNDTDGLGLVALQDALKEIRAKHSGAWCGPRWTSADLINFPEGQITSAKEVREKKPADEGTAIIQSIDDGLSKLFQCITHARRAFMNATVEQGPQHQENILQHWDGSYYNSEDEPANLVLSKQRFKIPPYSSFLLSDCKNVVKFRNHVRWMSQEYDTSRFFDFVLLDPPWPNTSVRRRDNYKTETGLQAIEKLINDMDLAQYLRAGGYVGIWITNKPAIRDVVLSPGGLFEQLNIGLVEEWVWVKTTTSGEPVTQLDGVWRKPYEALLLGRAPETRLEIAKPTDRGKRRVIAGVPDLHSRKPCLKTLIEPIIPDDYQALEVFARYLVSGWWSWGEEVLKFNRDGYYESVP